MEKFQVVGMILKNNSAHKKIAGITLIELLVVLLLLTIGMAALIKFQVAYFYYVDVSHQQDIAINLATNKISSLRNYEVIQTTTGKTAYNDIVSGTSTSTVNSTSYTITWTVTSFTNPDYKTINVQVSWADRRGNTKSVTLTSIISKMDPALEGVVMGG